MSAALQDGARPALSVEIRNVSHAFEIDGRQLEVLDDVSVDVKPGEFVSLLGPSGCGKSTLLRLVAGLDHPVHGSISAGGVPVEAPDPSRILVFQDPTLFPWLTVWKNVATGLDARGLLKTHRDRVDKALSLVRLERFATAYPHQLSGGMAQRVTLARALVNDPQVLLLDEPLGKLDSLTRLVMQNELLALWQKAGFTAILVTHDVEEALLLSDRVIVFSDRPARIAAEFSIASERPRRRDDPHLVALRQDILDVLHVGSFATDTARVEEAAE